MSKINGDKSRYNRMRKQNAAKRMRNRELLKNEIATRKRSRRSVSAKPSRWWRERSRCLGCRFPRLAQ